MIVSITVDFSTDGDFILRNIPDRDSAVFAKEYIDGEDCSLTRKYEVDENDYLHDARVYLEKILCDINVSYTHYYLIEYLYDLFDGALNALSLGNDYDESINGNYEGTSIRITFER